MSNESKRGEIPDNYYVAGVKSAYMCVYTNVCVFCAWMHDW